MQPKCLAGELGLCLKNRSHKRTKQNRGRKENKKNSHWRSVSLGKAQICIGESLPSRVEGQNIRAREVALLLKGHFGS